jgi:hypothetical protein
VLVLLQKTYIYETSSAPFRGCYVFVSGEFPRALRQGELARAIPADHLVDEIRVEAIRSSSHSCKETQLTTQQAQCNYMTNY